MAMAAIFLSIPLLFVSGISAFSASFTLTNNCPYTVWPGVLSSAGSAQIPTTGFALQKGDSKTLSAPASWSGRFWARTHCKRDSSSGNFSCATGDCGSGKMECAGGGATPPATLAEFTLAGSGSGLDFYDVSLVDGYNLPLSVVPRGGSGSGCKVTGCVVDLNGACPEALRVAGVGGGESVACKSACEAFGAPQYCCSGEYGNPNTCKPSSYSLFFKNACPRAYSYAYDDKTSTFTCASADYLITFCPAIGSQKASSDNGGHPKAADVSLPLVNTSMIFTGSPQDYPFDDISGAYHHHRLDRTTLIITVALLGPVSWLLLMLL